MRPCGRCKNPGCATRGMAAFNYEGNEITCYGFEPMTNADRIRAMTDEELAEMHVGVGCPPGTDLNELCFDENGEELLCTPPRCRECWLNWLRQEAKE